MYLSDYIFFFLPILLFFIYIIKCKQDGGFKSTISALYFIALIYILSIGLYPPEQDKSRYYDNFVAATMFREYKDNGWGIYNYVLRTILGELPWIFFIITSFIYVNSYILIAKKYISPKFRLPFFIVSFGALGFTSYGINTIRAGIAVAFCFMAFCQQSKKTFNLKQIILFVIAISMHKSTLVIIAGYYISQYIKKTKLFEYLWIVMLVLSMANVNFSDYFQEIGFIDRRVYIYTNASTSLINVYDTGFRIDFLIYSFIPILFSRFIRTSYNIQDIVWLNIYKIYLFCNAVWLTVIRAPFTDRFAYLSWCLIPFIIIYPYSKHLCFHKDTKNTLILLIIMFIIIPLYTTILKW